MKRWWSPTGCVFAAAFLGLAIWCLSSPSKDGGPLWILEFLTLPVSYLAVLFGSHTQSLLALPDSVIEWSVATLDVFWGLLLFYFLGWLLERPLRR